MHIEPPLPRYRVEQAGNGLRVTVPAARSATAVVFYGLWLCGWAFGETTVMHTLIKGQSPGAAFLLIWLIGWTLGGAWVVASLLWQLVGKELIAVEPGTLSHRVQLLGFTRTRLFAAGQVRRLRVVDYVVPTFTRNRGFVPPIFGKTQGPLVFDYGAQTIRMGQSLEEAEARQLLARLNALLPLGARME